MKHILFALALFFSPHVAQAQGTLILLIDVSSSLSIDEVDEQLNSYASVLTSIPYLKNINIEVILFDDDPLHLASGDAEASAGFLDDHPRLPAYNRGMTCLNKALKYIETVIPTVPQPVVLDISGDGEANCHNDTVYSGVHDPLHETLDRIEQTGTIVNTLFYSNQLRSNDTYGYQIRFYESLTRNSGFSMFVMDLMDFEMSLYNKIALEIAALVE